VGGNFNSSTTLSASKLKAIRDRQPGTLTQLRRESKSTLWLLLIGLKMMTLRARSHHGHLSMMIPRARSRRGHLSQHQHPKSKIFSVAHRLCFLSPVNNSVSKFLLRLVLLLVPVLSPPSHITLLFCLPAICRYFLDPCHGELLQHQPLAPHPSVGPTMLTEHKVWMIVSTRHSDGFHNSANLRHRWIMCLALLCVVIVLVIPVPISPLVPISEINIETTPHLLPHAV